MVRRVPRRDRGGRRPGGGVHAAPPAQLHRRGLQDPHDRERAAANRRRSAARPRRGAAGQCDAAVEGATLGRRAARRAGISEDLLVVLRRHEPARRGAQVRERAGRRDECRGAQSRATVLRLHRVPQVSWRSGPGRRTLRADAQGRRGIPDLRRGPPPGLAVSGRREQRRHLPSAAHRPRRHADAVVLRPDRPEVPDRRAAVAAGAVRAQPVAGADARGARRDPRAAARGSPPRGAGRLRVGARGPLLVPARRSGDPQAALVCARGLRRVGASGARRQIRRPAGELGRPLAQSRHDVARLRAARARDRGRGRFGRRPHGGPVPRPARGAVPAAHSRRNGAALLPDGGRDRSGLPVALDERHDRSGGRRSSGRAGARARPVRHSSGGPGRPDELRARGVAHRVHPLPCDPRYRQRTSVRSRPGHSGGVLRLGRIQRGTRQPAGGEHLVLPRPRPSNATEETVIVNPNGTLANVFVYVKSGLPETYKAPAPAGAVTLDQDGCRYHPHVLGILVGQPLEIKNSDGILHNIKAKGTKNRPFNISQPTTMTSTRTFTAPEVMVPLECNVHGWMHAWLGVLPHSFYGVSGADGSFSIKGLPPGTYTIEAWQEKYGTQTASVTVAGSETKTQDFTVAGK